MLAVDGFAPFLAIQYLTKISPLQVGVSSVHLPSVSHVMFVAPSRKKPSSQPKDIVSLTLKLFPVFEPFIGVPGFSHPVTVVA